MWRSNFASTISWRCYLSSRVCSWYFCQISGGCNCKYSHLDLLFCSNDIEVFVPVSCCFMTMSVIWIKVWYGSPLALLFELRIVLGIWNPLCFHMTVWMDVSISSKNIMGILLIPFIQWSFSLYWFDQTVSMWCLSNSLYLPQRFKVINEEVFNVWLGLIPRYFILPFLRLLWMEVFPWTLSLIGCYLYI